MFEELFMNRINWAATANVIASATSVNYNTTHLYRVANGRKSQRLSALLPTLAVKKIDWRAVAAACDELRPPDRTYKPRYIYEVAKGFRKNAQVFRLLKRIRVIEMLERQDMERKSFKQAGKAITNHQQEV